MQLLVPGAELDSLVEVYNLAFREIGASDFYFDPGFLIQRAQWLERTFGST